jgi:hypothetical protein
LLLPDASRQQQYTGSEICLIAYATFGVSGIRQILLGSPLAEELNEPKLGREIQTMGRISGQN